VFGKRYTASAIFCLDKTSRIRYARSMVWTIRIHELAEKELSELPAGLESRVYAILDRMRTDGPTARSANLM